MALVRCWCIGLFRDYGAFATVCRRWRSFVTAPSACNRACLHSWSCSLRSPVWGPWAPLLSAMNSHGACRASLLPDAVNASPPLVFKCQLHALVVRSIQQLWGSPPSHKSRMYAALASYLLRDAINPKPVGHLPYFAILPLVCGPCLASCRPPLRRSSTAASRTHLSPSPWLVVISGPPHTVYEGGLFVLQVAVPRGPFATTEVQMLTRIVHPNFDSSSGVVALDAWIDPKGFRHAYAHLSTCAAAIWSVLGSPLLDVDDCHVDGHVGRGMTSWMMDMVRVLNLPDPNDPQRLQLADMAKSECARSAHVHQPLPPCPGLPAAAQDRLLPRVPCVGRFLPKQGGGMPAPPPPPPPRTLATVYASLCDSFPNAVA